MAVLEDGQWFAMKSVIVRDKLSWSVCVSNLVAQTVLLARFLNFVVSPTRRSRCWKIV